MGRNKCVTITRIPILFLTHFDQLTVGWKLLAKKVVAKAVLISLSQPTFATSGSLELAYTIFSSPVFVVARF